MPYADRTEGAAEKVGRGQDDDDIAHQGDDHGMYAFAQTFQGSADDDGNRGNDEPEADDAQRLLSGQNGCRLVGEEAGKRTGEAQADDHAQTHDDGRQRQSGAEDLADTGIFFCAIVVADDGADTLYDAVGRQIDKGLQFIVDAQDENVHR